MNGYNQAAVLAGLARRPHQTPVLPPPTMPSGPGPFGLPIPSELSPMKEHPQPDAALLGIATAGRVYQTQYVRPLRQSRAGRGPPAKVVNGRPDLGNQSSSSSPTSAPPSGR